MTSNLIKSHTLKGELYFFRTVFTIVDLITNGFYYILLFKDARLISALFIDLIIFFIAQWAGYIIGNALIPRFGYVTTFKLSFLLNIIAMILLVISLPSLGVLYPIFAILRAFPKGLFWAVNNNYLLRELNDTNRSMVVSDVVSITYVLQILLPVLLGATITLDGNYSILFILSASISLVSLIIPWKYNKKPRTQVTSEEISKILKNKKFKSLSVFLLIGSGLDASIFLSFAIVPFLFLNNEFGVGILVSAINFIAAALAFVQRSKKIESIKKTSHIGNFLSAFANIILVIFWGFPGLVIRGLFATVGDSLYMPLLEKLDLDIREEILGDDVNRSSAEMGIIAETVFTIGRVLALIIFLFVFNIINSQNIFKLIILIYSFWIIFFLNSLMKLNKNKTKEVNLEDHLAAELSNSN